MTVQNITDSVVYGLAADTKPTNCATNTVYLEQDTGNIYRYNGSSWDLFRGASKTETLSNKTIDGADQADVKRTQVADFVRETGVLGACPSGVQSMGWLVGLTFLGASFAVQAVDSSHGLSELYTSATTANSSQAGNKSANAFTYRAWNPYFRLKCIRGSTTNNRLFYGFSSSGTTPTSDTYLQNGDSGVGIGIFSLSPNYLVLSNDGTGAMVSTDTGIAKDAALHSFEIAFNDSIPNCVVKMDGVTVATLTTRIPASGTPLYLYFFVEPNATGAQTFKLYNAWYEHKRTVTPL